MFKSPLFKVLLVGAVVIALGALLYAELYRPAYPPPVLYNQEAETVEPAVTQTSASTSEIPEDLSESGPTAGYTLAFSDEKQTLWIYKDETLIETIPVISLPAPGESKDYEGNDYEYYIYLSKTIPTVYDPNSKLIYFVVTNRTLSGNVNGEKAIYTYNVANRKISEIYSAFTAGLDELTVSPNGTYLVFTSGGHGGSCANFYDMAVFDLRSGDVIQHTTSPKFSGGTTGYATFLKWESDTAFTYEEHYISVNECLKSEGIDSAAESGTLRTHRIK